MNKKVYIGNLAPSSTEKSINELFSKCGTVAFCQLINDKDTGLPKGFAFVEMSTAEEAKEAIGVFNGHRLDGRELRVSEARSRESKPKHSSVDYGRQPYRKVAATAIDGSRGCH